MVEWVDPADVERLMLDAELSEDWRARYVDDAPYRSPDHWADLARLAGFSPAIADEAASDRTDDDHAGPASPPPGPVPGGP